MVAAMSSHAVVRILELHAPDEAGSRRAVVDLACGCQIDQRVPEERIVKATDGRTLIVGKYPCPLRHPVTRPPRDA